MMKETTNNSSKSLPLDYEKLKEYGLQYIQQIGNKHWTDFNAHDPGVTFLEAMCFSLTDLGYRTSFATNDLLTAKDSTGPKAIAPLFPAHQILSSNPTTITDYRKYILEHVPGVKNVWLTPTTRSINAQKPFKLGGIYDIALELENESYLLTEYIRRIVGRDHNGAYIKDYYPKKDKKGKTVQAGAYKDCFRHYVKNFLIKQRNLCEDFGQVKVLTPIQVGICAQIELFVDAQPKRILQEIYDKLEAYVSPSLPYHTIAELLDRGKTPEEIYQGVLPRYGFIDTDELKQYGKTEQLNTSDVISMLMKIEGIKSIKHFHFVVETNGRNYVNLSQSHLELLSDGHCLQFSSQFANASQENDAVTFQNNVSFIMSKLPMLPSEDDSTVIPRLSSRLPLDIVFGRMSGANDTDETDGNGFGRNLIQIKDSKSFKLGEHLITFETVINNDISPDFTVEMPAMTGRHKDTASYFSFQNLFPKAYKLGPEKIADSASKQRKAERLQLKAYLTFFDQLLSDYLAQLDSIEQYFSTNEVEGQKEQSYFFHQLNDDEITDVSQVLKDYGSLSENTEAAIDRRNRLLDHLMARFNDAFADYTTMAFFAIGDNAFCEGSEILNSKKHVFNQYAANSQARVQAIDYTEPLCVTGLEQRILYKLGIKHPEERIDLAPTLISSNQDGYYVFADNRELPFEETFGLHILEHTLLVPQTNKLNDKNHLKLYPIGSSDEFLDDPYSFRVTVVLPGWLKICQSSYFREWAEEIIREEMPAHIVAKICWINPLCMRWLELRYKSFLTTMARATHPNLTADWKTEQEGKIKLLIQSFNSFRNTYVPLNGYSAGIDSNAFRLDYTSLPKDANDETSGNAQNEMYVKWRFDTDEVNKQETITNI